MSVKEENRNGNTKTYTYDEAVELTGHGTYNYLLLIGCSIISNAVALDMFGYSIVVAAAKCDLQLGLFETGILASAPFIGVFFAYPWGYYADTRGRRRAILWSTSVSFVFASISSFSTSWPFLMFFKVVSCSFSNASFSLTMTILGECTGVRNRSSFLYILMSMNLLSECLSFGLAYLVLPVYLYIPIPFLNIIFNSWRLFTLILALPLGIGGFILYFLYESPKFLASRGNNEEALEVLRNIYVWNGGNRDEYPVEHITTDDTNKKLSFWQSIVEQTVPIFKPPLLWRTIQIFFLMSVCSSTNNAFVMWYPTIVNLFFNSITSTGLNNGERFCQRIFGENVTEVMDKVTDFETDICDATISPYTTISGVFYGLFFCLMTLLVAKVAAHKKLVLIFWLLISAVSGALVDLKQMEASLVFFILLQTSAIGLPSLAGYCVDLYPTAYRGLVTSLAMMCARIFSLLGVNLVGALITTNCSMIFYCWSAFVFFLLTLIPWEIWDKKYPMIPVDNVAFE